MKSEVNQQLHKVTVLAILAAAVLVVIKAGAWQATGSVALLGSLLDSVLDFSVSLMNFFAVRHAMTPADDEHRFGHGKAEALAAAVQGLVISVSAVFLLFESIKAFINPQPISESAIGIVVILVSIAITLGLVLVQRRVAQQTGSLAISADSAHYAADLYMNIGVIAALLLSGYMGLTYADPILGLVVVAILLNSAREVFIQARDQLMDHELDDEARERIRQIVFSVSDVLGMHDLRTRQSGVQVFVQCHIEIDGSMSLNQAHQISQTVESRIKEAFPGAEIIIHQDPHD